MHLGSKREEATALGSGSSIECSDFEIEMQTCGLKERLRF